MLEKICTNLETSKRLKELGIEVETEFYWAETGGEHLQYVESEVGMFHEAWTYTKAYTLEQILEMLPARLNIIEIPHDLVIDQKTTISYICDDVGHQLYSLSIGFDNLATTAGELLIKLKEDKLI